MWQLDRDILRVFQPAQGQIFVDKLVARQPRFGLVLAYTATVQLPGISGAGTTPQLRELTAAADAEILAHGQAHCLTGGVPSNPTGAPGPSIITRAAFDLLPAMTLHCVDAGLKQPPDVPDLLTIAGSTPAASLDTGQALPGGEGQALALFQAGLMAGRQLAEAYPEDYLIVAESVPGGTTTALGLLLSLGLDAEQRVSSSMPDNAHSLKLAAVARGMQASGTTKGAFAGRPLAGAAALGDPMQPVAAGMALAASAVCPALLAGGTQMAAVLALLAALRQNPPPATGHYFEQADWTNLGLATTRWVAADPTADLAGLALEIEQRFGLPPLPYLAANLDFNPSRYESLRLYEAGYVKEGVGAGAAALAAMLGTNQAAAELLLPIEQVYERIVLAADATN